MRRLLPILVVAALAACSEGTVEEMPLSQWAVEVATATSVGDEGQCQLDDWGSRVLLLAGDATIYASGYSDDRFCSLRVGMSRAEVLGRLGEPLSEAWELSASPDDTSDEVVVFVAGRVSHAWPEEAALRGLTRAEVVARRGAPKGMTLHYSSRDEDTHYRQRIVHVAADRVTRITAGVYVD